MKIDFVSLENVARTLILSKCVYFLLYECVFLWTIKMTEKDIPFFNCASDLLTMETEDWLLKSCVLVTSSIFIVPHNQAASCPIPSFGVCILSVSGWKPCREDRLPSIGCGVWVCPLSWTVDWCHREGIASRLQVVALEGLWESTVNEYTSIACR